MHKQKEDNDRGNKGLQNGVVTGQGGGRGGLEPIKTTAKKRGPLLVISLHGLFSGHRDGEQGTTIFTVFDKMDPARPEIDVKWDSKTHL